MVMILALNRAFGRSHTRARTKTPYRTFCYCCIYWIRRGNAVTDKDPFQAKIKLMKLVYLAEKAMAEMGFKGFNFFFNVYKHGPSSKELLKTLDDLQKKRLIHLDDKSSSIVLTDRGRLTIRDFIETSGTEKTRKSFRVVDDVVGKYAGMTTQQILDSVYAMDVTPMYFRIEKVNIGNAVKNGLRTRLLMRLGESDTKKKLEVSPDWVGKTLNVIMNPAFRVMAWSIVRLPLV